MDKQSQMSTHNGLLLLINRFASPYLLTTMTISTFVDNIKL